MNFILKSGEIEQKIDYSVDTPDNTSIKFIKLLAGNLTALQYHELCHQLHGTKAEFNTVDGECDTSDKYYFTVKSALYRGIFWATLNRLDEIEFNHKEDNWLDIADLT